MASHDRPPRTASARRTMTGLLLIPLLSLGVLWGFTASTALGNVVRNQKYNTLVAMIGPAVIGLEKTLEPERTDTILWLSTGRQSPPLRARLLAARRGTDTAAAAVRTAAAVRGLLSPAGQQQLHGFLAVLSGLPAIRAAVDAGTESLVPAFTSYAAISAAEYGFLHSATPPVDPALSLMTQASIAEARAEDFTAGAITLTEAAMTARGSMSQTGRVLLDQVIAEQNLAIDDAFSLAAPELAAVFREIFGAPAYRQLLTAETRITASPVSQPVPVPPDGTRVFQAVMASFDQPRIGTVLAAESARLSDGLLTELYLAGGVGLAAVAVSVYVTVRFARRLRSDLTGLYEVARQTADERLPRLVTRLRRGEDVDIIAESPPPLPARITEIASVARAFSAVQRTAAQAAVGEAGLRKNVKQVFVSLSMRSQSLLHRQLGMLDAMERATSDPVALADLFRLDHLTTRMRRHAEGLLILADAAPGRGWSDPVPAADVLNAAVAEVEDYVRVDVSCDCADAVAGSAVGDVIHLLAELIENATVFSPPQTRVEIRGEAVGRGFAVEIEDRGLGMTAAETQAHNQRLAVPPEFDLAGTDQLGLFIAATLAARHQVRISLRPSPYGGTTAIVLLPPEIMVPGHDAPAPGIHGSSRPWPVPVEDTAPQHPHPARGGMTGILAPPGGTPERATARLAAGELTALPADGWFTREPTHPGGNADANGIRAAGPGNGASTPGVPPAVGSRPDLPRRVPQASLAPQLRQAPGQSGASRNTGPTPPPPGPADGGPPGPSPQDAGNLLSDLQAGWERARAADPDHEEHS